MHPMWCPGINLDHWEANGLVGAWPLWDGGGDKAMDVSGNGNVGTLTSMDPATDWVVGEMGRCLDFDGVSDRVNITNPLGVLAQGTVMMWVNNTSFGNADYLFWGANPGRLYVTQSTAGDDGWMFRLGGGGYSVTSVIASGEWHHIAVSWQGTTANGYTDGILSIAGYAFTGTPGSASQSPSIGAYPSGILATAAKQQDVRVYNRALSASEVWHIAHDSQLYCQPRFPWGALPGGGAPPVGTIVPQMMQQSLYAGSMP